MVRREGSCFSNEDKPMEPSDVSDRAEELRTVVGPKRLKLPRKFLQDCNSVKQAPVPRKLRSAMKKRCRESPLLFVHNSKKPKHLIQGGESPKKDGARRTNKHEKSRTGFSGRITEDEEAVVEALYSLAGMFLNNGATCNSNADEEPAQDDSSAIPGGFCTCTNSISEAAKEAIKATVPSYNEERLSEENGGTHCPDGLSADHEPKLVDLELFRKEADNGAETDWQAISSHSFYEKMNHGLHASCNILHPAEPTLDSHINQPEKMEMLALPRKEDQKEVSVNTNQLDLNHKIEDNRYKGPVLWPGLLTTSVSQGDSSPLQLSRSKIAAWIDSSACSTKNDSGESWLPIEKFPKRRVRKILEKKCVKHVFISHLIRTLQMSVSKDELELQPNTGRQHEETTKQYSNAGGPRFNSLQDSSNKASTGMISSDSSRNSYGDRNVIRQKNRQSEGAKLSSPKNEGCNFSSLSDSIGRANQMPSPSYLQSVARQQVMSMSLPSSKTYYYSYPDQLSEFSASRSHQVQLQLPSYLGNSSHLLLHPGSIVIPKEKHHQQLVWAGQLASAHFKPTGSLKAISQVPGTLQNGRIISWDGSFYCNNSSSSTILR
ncbi:hypothetical protein SAY86_011352 [Trapa natans]|uniref:Uncharacterized protein n=1 Tax=Trapa natans TaxID=22666 RepID=A0AAN7R0P9_TRANT|nr:hypothetical protein SAY86_011352 [Trapa natans]